jgi:hypothetical protein
MQINPDLYFPLRDEGLWSAPIRAVLLDGSTRLAEAFLSGKSQTFTTFRANPVTFDSPDAGTVDSLRLETSSGELILTYPISIVSTGAVIRVGFTGNIWLDYDRTVPFVPFVLSNHTGESDHTEQYLSDSFGALGLCTFDSGSLGEIGGVDIRSFHLNRWGVEPVERAWTENVLNGAESSLWVVPFTYAGEGFIGGYDVPKIESGTDSVGYVSDIAPVISAERISDTEISIDLLNPITGYSVRLYQSVQDSSVFGVYSLISNPPNDVFDITDFPATVPATSGLNYKFKATYIVGSPVVVSPQSQIQISRGYNL